MVTTAVSAPGKVLIAGGYLVLDPNYLGIVISTSSRFYTVIRDNTVRKTGHIFVKSPQFLDGEWEFVTRIEEGSVTVEYLQKDTVSKNKFVHLALQRILLLVLELKGHSVLSESLSKGLEITIVGDNDFYSQRAQLAARNFPKTIAALSSLPPFVHCGVPLTGVHKTGLGSSAALITSVVCALLLHTGVVSSVGLQSSDDSDDRLLVHNVAQYVHCLAQGKIGSGFDVSSAVFGSQLYRRFDPAAIQPLMTDAIPTEPLLTILSPSNLAWNQKVVPFKLPPLMHLMLADVDAGSDTPSLVGKVLSWRKNNAEEALKLWTELSGANGRLVSVLSGLAQIHSNNAEVYATALSKCANLTHDEWKTTKQQAGEAEVVDTLSEAFSSTEDIRRLMRQMGSLSGVPIEPPTQTKLLDACVSIPGVVGGGVPGAGGYDAIWVLVVDTRASGTSPLERVEKVWAERTEMNVSPLSASESHDRGVRIEDVERVPGLSSIVHGSP